MTDSCQKTPIGRPIGNTGVNLLDASARLEPIGASGEFCSSGEDLSVGADIETVKEKRCALAAVAAGWRHFTGVIPAAGAANDGLLALSGRDRAECLISARVAGPEPSTAANASLEAAAAYAASCIPTAAGADTVARRLEGGFAEQVMSPFGIGTAQVNRRRLRSAPPTAVETPPSDVQATEVSSEGRASSAVVAPAAVVGERLASICEELLGVTPVGVQDNLLGRGGHSLLTTLLPARIDSAIGVRRPLRAMFRAPTIRLRGGLIGEQLQLAAVAALGCERKEFKL